MKNRMVFRLLLSLIALVIMVLGWKYPYLGLFVLFTIIVNIFIGFFAGRWSCGNLCPRGAFYDIFLNKISRNKDTPKLLKSMYFRYLFFIFFALFVSYRLSLNITSFEHIGRVFWLSCVVTTLIGVIGSIFYNPRFWCAFCPIGTLNNIIGGNKKTIKMNKNNKCIGCSLCSKKCKMFLNPTSYIKNGEINNRDCIKCGECVRNCPKKVFIK